MLIFALLHSQNGNFAAIKIPFSLSFQIISVQRNTQLESRFHPRMGWLSTRVTRIQKTILGIPYQTLHKYRETYFGQIKDCADCEVARMEPAY